MAFTTCSPRVRSRPWTSTCQPCFPSRSATTRPTPFVAPVTKATRSAICAPPCTMSGSAVDLVPDYWPNLKHDTHCLLPGSMLRTLLMSSALPYFHDAVYAWFGRTFPAPTPAQAWPAIQSGQDVLIAAPTGSGKTLAAFLAAIDELVREGEQWGLPDETRVLYVSPLKALSNDINRNLEAPLNGIREELRKSTIRDVEIRTWVRTGDTPQYERTQMRRKPPHIVVTTPESLYILLGSPSGRQMLATTRTVIVDEIHAVAGTKRGSHLAISLERLDALAGRRIARIGLSATQ